MVRVHGVDLSLHLVRRDSCQRDCSSPLHAVHWFFTAVVEQVPWAPLLQCMPSWFAVEKCVLFKM